MKPAPTLARQLGFAIGGMLTCAVIFIASASAGVDYLIELELKSRQPAKLLRAIEALDQNRLPANEDMLALIKLTSEEGPRVVALSYTGVALLTLICIALSVFIARHIARRLAASVNLVADGAQRIAAGDFAHRIVAPPKLTRELQSLIDSFNTQAEALERSERQMRFSTASVAHELRTPLTVLSGYIHGALDGLFPRDDNHMRALLTQVEDLSRIIDDLRTVSLASSGALVLEIGSCDLAAEARSVLEMTRPQFLVADMAVDAALPETWVRADPARVRQMLLAVLDNARRYAAEGRSLSLRVQRQGETGVLLVADRGPGFPPDGEQRAFEWFWRADLSRTRATGGSGLGLAVVKALADAHGGSVGVGNRSSGGAVIELRFPLDPAALDGCEDGPDGHGVLELASTPHLIAPLT
jgi:two-component system sensor histidine kinase AdeS